MQDIIRYFLAWFHEWITELLNLGKEKLAPTSLSLVILLMEWKFGLIQSGQGRSTLIVRLLVPVGFFVLWYAGRAVVQLDKRKTEKIAEMQTSLEGWPARVRLINLLRGYHREGELLKEEIEQRINNQPERGLTERIESWQKRAANTLLQECGAAFEDKFEKLNQKTGLNDLAKVHEQTVVIREAMNETESLPDVID
jgi:hypothetical protein